LATFITPTSTGTTSLENGETWEFKVQVTNYGTSSPQFQSWGIVKLPDGTTVTRELATPLPGVNAATPSPAAVFVNAVAATSGSVNLGSGTSVDSYSSNPYVAPGVLFSAVVLSGNPSLAVPGVTLGSGTIVEGYAVGTNANSVSYVPGSSRVIGPGDSASVFVDQARLIANPQPYQPLFTEVTPSGGTPTTINLVGTQTMTLGSPGATVASYYVIASGVSLTGSSVLTIAGPVVLVVTGGGFVISGNAQIYIDDTQTADGGPYVSLEIHLPSGSGNTMSIAGNGIYNSTGDSRRVIIMGSTNTSAQSLGDAANNPLFAGTVYFPNAPLTVVGNPIIYGSLVAQSISFSGSPIVHYDTVLRTPPAPPMLGYPSFSSFNQPNYNPPLPPIALGALTEMVPAGTPTF
jgi:hypothetical protein